MNTHDIASVSLDLTCFWALLALTKARYFSGIRNKVSYSANLHVHPTGTVGLPNSLNAEPRAHGSLNYNSL